MRGLAPGRAQYSALLTDEGTYVDDLVVYRLEAESILLVVNASNTAKDLAWIRARATDGVTVDDVSDATALLALQGPRSSEILGGMTAADLRSLLSFRLVSTTVAGAPAVVSRTGYTGEDGFEIFVAAGDAARVWTDLLDAGRERGLVPAGLGARDSLRLEAGLCLYGHEIDETVTPFEVGLDWVVKLEDRDFVGRDALLRQRAAGVPRRLVGLELEGRRIGRAGATVWSGDEAIGRVTSGTWSPHLEQSIAMALVGAGHAARGSAGRSGSAGREGAGGGARASVLPPSSLSFERPRRSEGVDVS